MDKGVPPVRLEFQDPNLAKLADIASKDKVDISESIRVIANVLLSMEGYTLRDVRNRMASLDNWRIEFTRNFELFQEGLEASRYERNNLELEQAQLIVNRSQKISTSQKIKTVINEEKQKDSINWKAIWRDKVLPNLITAISIAIAFAALQLLILPILEKALVK